MCFKVLVGSVPWIILIVWLLRNACRDAEGKNEKNLRFDFGKINSLKADQIARPIPSQSPTVSEAQMSPSPPPTPKKIKLPELAAPKGSLNPEPKATLNEYLDLDNPAAYSGRVAEKLKSIESVSRHKRRMKKFLRRKVYVGGPYTQIQADLIHYRHYSRQNNGYKYILAVIDCFSRKNYCRPMKTATAEETARKAKEEEEMRLAAEKAEKER